jgi:hypothetical protein
VGRGGGCNNAWVVVTHGVRVGGEAHPVHLQLLHEALQRLGDWLGVAVVAGAAEEPMAEIVEQPAAAGGGAEARQSWLHALK